MTRGTEPGYRRQPKVYRLVFEKHPGLVVRTRSSSVEMFLEVVKLKEQDLTPEIARFMFEQFSSVLISWNLEYEEDGPADPETGKPQWCTGDLIPATYEGLIQQDWDFAMAIIYGWMEAVTGVSAPLETPSPDGKQSPVELIPMEIQSVSRVS